MKKGDVIKRRKRVMPALSSPPQPPQQQQAGPHQQRHPDSSASPDPPYQQSPASTTAAATASSSLPVHPRDPAIVLEPSFQNNGPPPVDFTQYSRKRAFGDGDGSGAATTHSGDERDRVSPRGSGESIDPSLAGGAAAESKAQVRARLQRERQRMREELLAVENELARMEEDG